MRTLLVGISGLMLCAGAMAQDGAGDKELQKIQGTWRVVSISRDGKEQKPENATSTVSGDKFTTKSDGKVVREGSLKLFPSQRPYRATDATYSGGPDQGKTLRGIYTLDGDTWILCYSAPGEERPRAFPEKGGKAYLMLVLKRDRP